MGSISAYKNPQIAGSLLIGIALVGGAYLFKNFSTPSIPNPSATAAIITAPVRPYIPVIDADNNGIEDWREEFMLQESIVLPSIVTETPYVAPTTLTGQISEQFFESIIRQKISGGIGPTAEQIITRTTETVARLAVTDGLYTASNIVVVATTNDAIRTYANIMGQSIIDNDITENYENELVIMQRALANEDQSEMQRLVAHASMYQALRDTALQTPVPQAFVKEHLDLINTYHALYKGLSDMQLAFIDPVVTLLRINRYQDDARGLAIALSNIYTALLPHVALFGRTDPAVIFVAFAPMVQ